MSGVRDYVLIGAGPHAKVVAAAVMAAGHVVRAAFDDDEARWGTTILGVPIAGPILSARDHADALAVIAIGSNATRARLARSLHLDWGIVVHPRAWVHETVRLGPGTVVFAGAIMQPDVVTGAHVIVNTSASVDHDCILGDFVHVAPGTRLAGGVSVGDESFLGVGACAIPGVSIGRGTTVGAGGVVTRNVPDGVVSVGVPARILRRMDP